jgi:HD-like signal output (HDOD) protein
VSHTATEQQLLDELKALPMRDGALAQVLQVLNDPESPAQRVADTLQSDPALCARLLKLVNSPAYGLAGKVKSVDRAVIALGRSTVRALALSEGAGLFAGGTNSLPPRYWEHSAAVAVTTSLLAKQARVSTADAMCAGLMHDLGAALLHQRDPQTYSTMLETPETLVENEKLTFGCDHAQLTRLAFAAWGLPGDVATAISFHHQPQDSYYDRLSHLIVAAEALSFEVLGEAVHFGEPSGDLGVALDHLDLLPSSVEPLRDQIADEAAALGAAFS